MSEYWRLKREAREADGYWLRHLESTAPIVPRRVWWDRTGDIQYWNVERIGGYRVIVAADIGLAEPEIAPPFFWLGRDAEAVA